MSAPAISVKGVEVAAGAARLIGPVDLEVGAGEHVLLVGPSGCGKTTLLRAIAGLSRPRAGRIELFGRLASDGARTVLPPEKRDVGFLFQGGALWPHMTVRKTLDFVLKHGQVPSGARPRRIAELLEQVSLTGVDDRRPGTLSGGEAQRLALARALAVQPRLLLLDEPLGPLDAELRGELIAMLGRLGHDLDLTILHVTHDPGEAAALATHTVRMADGRIADGATR